MDNNNAKMTPKEWLITGAVVLLLFLGLSSCSFIFSDDSSGGKCKYCRQETQWTYENGGWVCYSCSH